MPLVDPMNSNSPTDDDDRTVMPQRAADLSQAAQADSMMSAQNALPVGTRLGEFEITEIIGAGGFGIVYLAEDHSLHRKVALKEYMPAALAARTGGATVAVKSERHAETFQAGLRSFINEARLLAQFDHPSLVKVYRFWEGNGTAYMVMPFYEGMTLKQVLGEPDGHPDEAWLKRLLGQLLDALGVIHKEHCFHRDVSPDNILILKDGRPLLLDFGAARQVIGDMTQGLTVILKPGYAPVEQYADTAPLKQGPWTDIYALAAVVYYAITGKAPLPAVGRVMQDSLVPLSEAAAGRYSAAFLQGIDKALAVKPEDRPQSVSELRTLLGLAERRRQDRGVAAGVPPDRNSRSPEARAGRKHRPVAVYAAAVAALAAAVGAAVFFTGGKTAEISPAAESKPATAAPQSSGMEPKPAVAPSAVPGSGAAPLSPAPSPAGKKPSEPARIGKGSPLPGNADGAAEAAAPARATVQREPGGKSRPAARPGTAQSHLAPGTSSITIENRAGQCSDILQRASLGEPLTPQEEALLRRDCK
jgi:hypothetical protein